MLHHFFFMLDTSQKMIIIQTNTLMQFLGVLDTIYVYFADHQIRNIYSLHQAFVMAMSFSNSREGLTREPKHSFIPRICI